MVACSSARHRESDLKMDAQGAEKRFLAPLDRAG